MRFGTLVGVAWHILKLLNAVCHIQPIRHAHNLLSMYTTRWIHTQDSLIVMGTMMIDQVMGVMIGHDLIEGTLSSND